MKMLLEVIGRLLISNDIYSGGVSLKSMYKDSEFFSYRKEINFYYLSLMTVQTHHIKIKQTAQCCFQ